MIHNFIEFLTIVYALLPDLFILLSWEENPQYERFQQFDFLMLMNAAEKIISYNKEDTNNTHNSQYL